jgi:hypothetical protein
VDESYDYDNSYLSSNSEEVSLVKGGDDDDDEIDVEKLDFEDRALLARINALKEFLPQYQMSSQKPKHQNVPLKIEVDKVSVEGTNLASPGVKHSGTTEMEKTSPEPLKI